MSRPAWSERSVCQAAEMSCDWLACGVMATQASLDQLPVRGDLRVGPPGPEMASPRSANQ
eukprot:2409035-Alexandrium_andersonii.AAC.1